MHNFFKIPLLRFGAAFALVVAAPLSWAHGQPDVSWSVTLGSPQVYAPPVVYAPAPPVVYVQPAPVYVRPRPVYVQPTPIVTYSQPYYVGEGRYWRHGHHHGKHGRFND
jgi:hypothetical protein